MSERVTYKAEILFIDHDGVARPAKIVGYDENGELPAKRDGETRCSASEAGLTNLQTRGIDWNGETPVQSDKLVAIKQFRTTETKSGRLTKPDSEGKQKEIVAFRAYVDLMVDFGGKRAGRENWRFVRHVSYRSHINGPHLVNAGPGVGVAMDAVRYFTELPPPEVKPFVLPLAPQSIDEKAFDALTDEQLRTLATTYNVNLGNTIARDKIVRKLIEGGVKL